MDNFDLRKYLAENRLLKEERNVLNFGPFKNVEYKQRPDGEIFLIATDSDNFRKIEDNLEYETDKLTDEQISYLNNEVEKLANEMGSYLTSKGIDNEIYDDQLGYGQEIDNLVIAIREEDLPNLSENTSLREEGEENIYSVWVQTDDRFDRNFLVRANSEEKAQEIAKNDDDISWDEEITDVGKPRLINVEGEDEYFDFFKDNDWYKNFINDSSQISYLYDAGT